MSSRPLLRPLAVEVYRVLARGGRWSVRSVAEAAGCSVRATKTYLGLLEHRGLAYRYREGRPACWERNGGKTCGPLPDAWVAIDPRGAIIQDPNDIIGEAR